MSGRFDPAAWSREAISAGLDPFARCYGSRLLVTREKEIDHRPTRWPLDDHEQELVIDALIHAGRWEGGWPWCATPGAFGPPLAGPGVFWERV